MHWRVSRAWKPKISRLPREATSTSLTGRPRGISSCGQSPGDRQAGAGHEGDVQGLGLVDHLLGLGPAVGEVLVDEHRHAPPRGPEDVEDLAEVLAAGVELLELGVERVVAVLGDQQDGVDRELAGARA